jgi:hypothetical protein
MIIWSGYGFIIFVIVFIDSLIAELLSQTITHNNNYYQENLTPLGISFIVSGLIIEIVKKYFDRKRENNEGTRVFDKVTIAKKGHHLFFIPFGYWTYIMIALGTAVIIYQFLK